MAAYVVLLAPLLLAETSAPGLAGDVPGASQAQREVIQQQLAGIQQQLEGIREQLAAQRAERQAEKRWQAQLAQGLDTASGQLQALESQLAYGSTDGAPAVLEHAARVAAAAHLRGGEASIAAAEDALARGDLFAARQAVAGALTTIAGAMGQLPGGY